MGGVRSERAFLRSRGSRDNRRIPHRMIIRSTPSDNQNKLQNHSQRISLQRPCRTAYLCRCHWIRIRFGRMYSSYDRRFTRYAAFLNRSSSANNSRTRSRVFSYLKSSSGVWLRSVPFLKNSVCSANNRDNSSLICLRRSPFMTAV